MRVCWNWQTGTFEGRVSIDVRVQVPSLAPVAAGGLAAAGPEAIAGLQEVLGGAFSTAVGAIQLPGEAAVAATLGGVDEAAAAAADAAVASGGVGALMSTFVVPVLIAAGAGAGVM